MDLSRSASIRKLDAKSPWLGRFVSRLSEQETWMDSQDEAVDNLIRGFRDIRVEQLQSLAKDMEAAVAVLGIAPAWMCVALLQDLEERHPGFLLSSLLFALERLEESPEDTSAQLYRDRIVSVYRAEVMSSLLRIDRVKAAADMVERVTRTYGGFL